MAEGAKIARVRVVGESDVEVTAELAREFPYVVEASVQCRQERRALASGRIGPSSQSANQPWSSAGFGDKRSIRPTIDTQTSQVIICYHPSRPVHDGRQGEEGFVANAVSDLKNPICACMG
jgi:hypothetical protein